MSSYSTSLVPASGGFSQQGSLDWVALGNMQYSASIAVLGRLSKAGIDNLTVAFGQAMCSKLPIGSHGEKVLNQAMRGLGAKSIAGDLIWFGVGIRHVLRDLVQTSQGCCLIALCAALAEGYPHAYAALVLYEMAKAYSHQAELTPSFAQWEALVHVAAPTFVGTTLGNRIQQMSRFAPQCGERIENPHPSDLIKTIFDIAKIHSGELRSIYVQGNMSCSWIAVWSDFILGLRVLVRNEHGHAVYANFDPEQNYTQVNIGFITTQGSSDIIHAGSTHLMRSGRDFISEFLDEDVADDIDTYFFSCGRVSWESMFTERFGDQFSVLITNPRDIISEGAPLEPRSDTESWDGKSPYDNFVQSLAILAVLFVISSVGTLRNSPEAFVNRACKACPELKACKEDWLHHVNSIARKFNCTPKELWDLDSQERSALTKNFCSHLETIEKCCECSYHARDRPGNFSAHSSTKKTFWTWCIHSVTTFVMQMLLHLDRVILRSPLTPSMDGLAILYGKWDIKSIIGLMNSFPGKRPIYPAPETLLSLVMILFSHTKYMAEVDMWPEQICCGGGDIYAYMHIMKEITDEWELARMIHVGVGHIQFNSRIHSEIHDYMPNPRSFPQYRARGKQTVGNIDCLACDSTSETINAKALIKDKARGLFYCHQIDSSSGTIQIPPLSFLRKLHRVLDYGISKRRSGINSIDWMRFLKNQKYVRVDGEGFAGSADECSFLRPHKGNTLGRCVVISFQVGSTVLVKTDEALEIFARDWAFYAKKEARCHVLIS